MIFHVIEILFQSAASSISSSWHFWTNMGITSSNFWLLYRILFNSASAPPPTEKCCDGRELSTCHIPFSDLTYLNMTVLNQGYMLLTIFHQIKLHWSFFYSFSNIGPMADLMSSSYLDKNSCYNSQVYGQNYSSHCYYGNMEYLSSGVSHSSLNVPSVSILTFFLVIMHMEIAFWCMGLDCLILHNMRRLGPYLLLIVPI